MNYRDILFYKYLHGSGGSQPAWDGATFSSYAKGTEQILPENEADPDSSPFLGDIRYPDGTRRNNYFLYRESPNTVDGQAKITRIKGNTLVWNQLVENGNFASTSGWGARQGTLSVSNNIATVTPSSDGTERGLRQISNVPTALANHKYFISVDVLSPINSTVVLSLGGANPRVQVSLVGNTWKKATGIVVYSSDYTNGFYALIQESLTTSQSVQFKNAMFVDLTQMGLDTLTADQFIALYPLPYYDYTTGKLLPFVGTELKTTGKNLLNLQEISGTYMGISYLCQKEVITLNGTVSGEGAFILDISILNQPQFESGRTYIKSLSPIGECFGVQTSIRKSDKNILGFWSSNAENATESTLSGVGYYFRIQINNGISVNCTIKAQIEENNVATNFEPYTSSTINLPTLTYFPSGMKSARSAYDEITESKAITRIGSVDLGSLNWTRSSTSTSGKYAFLASLPNIKTIASSDDLSNIICSKYSTVTRNEVYRRTKTGISGATTENIFIYDPNYEDAQDATAFKASLSGQYLYFELATPTEEPISSQTEIQNQALSTILGKTVSVDSPEEPLNILLKGE